MHAFEYHRPSSMKDAIALGGQKSEGRYLAGGQSLVPALKPRPPSPAGPPLRYRRGALSLHTRQRGALCRRGSRGRRRPR